MRRFNRQAVFDVWFERAPERAVDLVRGAGTGAQPGRFMKQLSRETLRLNAIALEMGLQGRISGLKGRVVTPVPVHGGRTGGHYQVRNQISGVAAEQNEGCAQAFESARQAGQGMVQPPGSCRAKRACRAVGFPDIDRNERRVLAGRDQGRIVHGAQVVAKPDDRRVL